MRHIVLGITTACAVLGGVAHAGSLTYGFGYTQGADTYQLGTVTLSTSNVPDLLTVRVTAPGSGPSAISGAQITGIVFAFAPAQAGLAVLPQNAGTDAGDLDGVAWTRLNNPGTLPAPSNTGSVTAGIFNAGASTGGPSGFMAPGVGIGQYDVFTMTGFALPNAMFARDAWNALDLTGLISHVGIIVQGLDDSVGGGRLFLVGSPPTATSSATVPEPAGLALFGMAMLGLRLSRRRGD